MDKNLIKLFPFTKPYQSHIFWNVTYNVLYALFSTISMLTLLPMLEVLFGKTKEIEKYKSKEKMKEMVRLEKNRGEPKKKKKQTKQVITLETPSYLSPRNSSSSTLRKYSIVFM